MIMILAEKEAEDFLKKNGFLIIENAFIKHSKQLFNVIKKFEFPFVMKVSGKTIIHKRKIGGVKLNIGSYESALKNYNKLKKIKGFEGVIIQKKIKGKEILIGLKKTPEFGHVIVFGQGGSDVEKKRDVSFRVCPLKKNDFIEIIKDTKAGKDLNDSEKNVLIKVLEKICSLSLKFPRISELDINPLIIENKKYYVADARIVL